MQSLELEYPISHGKRQRHSLPQVLAIGEFDGVHLGHQEVIKHAVNAAAGLGLPSSVMTFHPHPREVLGQCKYVQLLTPLAEKERLLGGLGVDNMYIVSFNRELMTVTPEQFVENMLLPMNVNTVVVGFDFRFGYQGAGTPDTLCELSRERFTVEVIRPFHRNGSKVSSTLVREHLLAGRVVEANALLGRPYVLRGRVVTGEGRGRTIGFPTANIELSEPFIVPALGVYAVRVTVGGHTHHGVMNIGKKPTFFADLSQPTLEVHIFDFSESIYGNLVSLELISYLRPERKFASVDELIAQIGEDAESAKALLAAPSN
ncbi:bifunctional riboflavin kinase/FAD synthetase [Paenibacillus xerothermodurans]|uniref:Riboflavin biosynthesis protein n=1 Tax=Paenibacillus xerothermodurans TaxID=1977292 RepID=A0A2W1ND32_PAEXE|nr:bifunctional riboflavin kinase/FAD synthetase [Paenibacillus xerothermodurans]PZE22407.1 bifunctional riboflavin kinase/FAD synthetase [Paenibacillus xerothermodurans]